METNICAQCMESGRCGSLRLYQVNFEEAIYLCTNEKCLYPLKEKNISDFIVMRNAAKVFGLKSKTGSVSSVNSVHNFTTTIYDLPIKPTSEVLNDKFQECLAELKNSLGSVEDDDGGYAISSADFCSTLFGNLDADSVNQQIDKACTDNVHRKKSDQFLKINGADTAFSKLPESCEKKEVPLNLTDLSSDNVVLSSFKQGEEIFFTGSPFTHGVKLSLIQENVQYDSNISSGHGNCDIQHAKKDETLVCDTNLPETECSLHPLMADLNVTVVGNQEKILPTSVSEASLQRHEMSDSQISPEVNGDIVDSHDLSLNCMRGCNKKDDSLFCDANLPGTECPLHPLMTDINASFVGDQGKISQTCEGEASLQRHNISDTQISAEVNGDIPGSHDLSLNYIEECDKPMDVFHEVFSLGNLNLAENKHTSCNNECLTSQHIYPLWQNRDALCWLDAAMSLIVHNKRLQKALNKLNNSGQCHVEKLCQDYEEMVHILNCANQNTVERDLVHSSILKFLKNRMESTRENVFSFLEPKLQCVKGREESPLFALHLLLKENEAVQKLFLLNYHWLFKCEVCGFFKDDKCEKTVPSFPDVACDFSFTNAYFKRPCFNCKVPDQKRYLQFDSLPSTILMHFLAGLPSGDLSSYDFTYKGEAYVVTGIIQYKLEPRHFIAWIRSYSDKTWLCCDDLKSELGHYVSETPNISPSELHILMWEKLGDFFESGKCVEESTELLFPDAVKAECSKDIFQPLIITIDDSSEAVLDLATLTPPFTVAKSSKDVDCSGTANNMDPVATEENGKDHIMKHCEASSESELQNMAVLMNTCNRTADDCNAQKICLKQQDDEIFMEKELVKCDEVSTRHKETIYGKIVNDKVLANSTQNSNFNVVEEKISCVNAEEPKCPVNSKLELCMEEAPEFHNSDRQVCTNGVIQTNTSTVKSFSTQNTKEFKSLKDKQCIKVDHDLESRQSLLECIPLPECNKISSLYDLCSDSSEPLTALSVDNVDNAASATIELRLPISLVQNSTGFQETDAEGDFSVEMTTSHLPLTKSTSLNQCEVKPESPPLNKMLRSSKKTYMISKKDGLIRKNISVESNTSMAYNQAKTNEVITNDKKESNSISDLNTKKRKRNICKHDVQPKLSRQLKKGRCTELSANDQKSPPPCLEVIERKAVCSSSKNIRYKKRPYVQQKGTCCPLDNDAASDLLLKLSKKASKNATQKAKGKTNSRNIPVNKQEEVISGNSIQYEVKGKEKILKLLATKNDREAISKVTKGNNTVHNSHVQDASSLPLNKSSIMKHPVTDSNFGTNELSKSHQLTVTKSKNMPDTFSDRETLKEILNSLALNIFDGMVEPCDMTLSLDDDTDYISAAISSKNVATLP